MNKIILEYEDIVQEVGIDQLDNNLQVGVTQIENDQTISFGQPPFYIRSGHSPRINPETETWWEYNDEQGAFIDTGVSTSSQEKSVFNANAVSDFPSIGEPNVIYKAEKEKKLYQWNPTDLKYESVGEANLEAVKINGTLLDITNKTVDIPMSTADLVGLVKSSDEENKISVTTDGTMLVNSLNVNKLTQTDGEVLILDSGSSV